MRLLSYHLRSTRTGDARLQWTQPPVLLLTLRATDRDRRALDLCRRHRRYWRRKRDKQLRPPRAARRPRTTDTPARDPPIYAPAQDGCSTTLSVPHLFLGEPYLPCFSEPPRASARPRPPDGVKLKHVLRIIH